MFRKPISGRWRFGLGVASICFLALLYTFISWRQHQINPADKTIPTWGQIISGLIMVATENDEGTIWLWEDGKATFVRFCVGLIVGVSTSIVIGIAMGSYPVSKRSFCLRCPFWPRFLPRQCWLFSS